MAKNKIFDFRLILLDRITNLQMTVFLQIKGKKKKSNDTQNEYFENLLVYTKVVEIIDLAVLSYADDCEVMMQDVVSKLDLSAVIPLKKQHRYAFHDFHKM